MSRSGYSDDCDDDLALGRWRGVVASSIRGKRGQAFLRDLLAALDALPDKRLVAGDLERDGEVCAIGALGRQRGVDMAALDPEDYDTVASAFNIASPLAQEVVYMNDERQRGEKPEGRWLRMRDWVAHELHVVPPPQVAA